MALVRTRLILARWRPRLRLLGDNVPSVDCIVTVCNENLDVVRDTVLAALHVDYPPDRLRVIVADDGASPRLRAWVDRVAAEGAHANLHYVARVRHGAAGYKAGNLNHAVAFAARLPSRSTMTS